LFWWLCRSLGRNVRAIRAKAGSDLDAAATPKYGEMAHEGAGIV
jgi:hypothetical protein